MNEPEFRYPDGYDPTANPPPEEPVFRFPEGVKSLLDKLDHLAHDNQQESPAVFEFKDFVPRFSSFSSGMDMNQ